MEFVLSLFACLLLVIGARAQLRVSALSPAAGPAALRRTAQARTREALESVIRTATEWISEQDAQNWFDHCGYHVH